MADVSKIDIDGIQWDIKDQEARNQIAKLEENNSAKSISDININLNEGYSAEKALLSTHYKIGKIHFTTIVIQNLNGKNVGTTSTAIIGKIPINLFDITQFLLFNAYNSVVARCYILKDGSIAIAESAGINAGNNYIVGELIFAEA